MNHSAMQPAHEGPNYQGTINPDAAYEIARDEALSLTPQQLLHARVVRLIRESGELMAQLVNVRDGIEDSRDNEDSIRIVESEFAFARRALGRVSVKAPA